MRNASKASAGESEALRAVATRCDFPFGGFHFVAHHQSASCLQAKTIPYKFCTVGAFAERRAHESVYIHRSSTTASSNCCCMVSLPEICCFAVDCFRIVVAVAIQNRREHDTRSLRLRQFQFCSRSNSSTFCVWKQTECALLQVNRLLQSISLSVFLHFQCQSLSVVCQIELTALVNHITAASQPKIAEYFIEWSNYFFRTSR